MIILDTNVVSEMMRPSKDSPVEPWIGLQPTASLFTTALTRAEILYGIEVLPPGKRRTGLATAVKAVFEKDFEGRVLPFDQEAADAYATLVAERRRAGRPISPFDAQIAAIARSRGAALATRNTRDFEGCGVTLLDPWA